VITIAICTYHRYNLLRLALESCLDQTLDADQYKIVVVDNSSEPLRAEEEKSRHAGDTRVQYLVEKIPGLSNARNVAARACQTPYIAYLDDDAQASRSWLHELLAAFRLPGADVGVVGGRIEPRWESSPPPWLHQDLFRLLSIQDWGGSVMRRAGPRELLAGANLAFRTELIAQAGYFSTRLGRMGGDATLVSNEESELASRIRAAGYACVYTPTASVSHLVPTSRLRQSWFRKRIAWQAASDLMTKPESMTAWAHRSGWKKVTEYLEGLPSAQRSPASLYQAVDDPVQFKRQVTALYWHTLLTLSGFELAETPGQAQATGTVNAKVAAAPTEAKYAQA
jgi:glycosyltransferase involved in cell wall biosynthesis